MGRGEKVFFLFLPLAIELKSSFTSFLLLFFKKANLDHGGSLFPEIIFNSNLENTHSDNLIEEKIK